MMRILIGILYFPVYLLYTLYYYVNRRYMFESIGTQVINWHMRLINEPCQRCPGYLINGKCIYADTVHPDERNVPEIIDQEYMDEINRRLQTLRHGEPRPVTYDELIKRLGLDRE